MPMESLRCWGTDGLSNRLDLPEHWLGGHADNPDTQWDPVAQLPPSLSHLRQFFVTVQTPDAMGKIINDGT